jgi:hypothetical protein
MKKSTVKKHLILLDSIKNLPDKDKKVLIRNLPPSVIQAVSETCLNIAASPACAGKLTKRQKQKLRKYRTEIIALADRKTPLTTKRKHIMRGGFLSLLLGTALPLLFSLLQK